MHKTKELNLIKKTLGGFVAIASLAVFLVSTTGCSGSSDESQAPSKAEIDKGLQGKPAVDPNAGAPMKPGLGGK